MAVRICRFGDCFRTLKIGLLIACFLTILGKQSLYSQIKGNATNDEQNYATYIAIGDSMVKANDISTALSAYRKALLIDPSDEKLIQIYLKCLLHQNPSISNCNEFGRLYEDALFIGNKCLELKRYEEAKKYFRMALETYPFEELPREKLKEIADIISHK